MALNGITNFFLFAQRAKNASTDGRRSPQELEVGLRSGLYLLGSLIIEILVWTLGVGLFVGTLL